MKKLSLMAIAALLTACSGSTETAETAASNNEPAATQATVDRIEKEMAEKKAMIAKERAEKEAMIAKEKAEKEAMQAKAQAEKEAMAAKEAAEKEAMIAKEKAEKDAMIAKERAEKEAMLAKERAEKEAMVAREAANRETARLEAERQEAARQEAARQEAIRQDAARQEAARQEAARQETARIEAARVEAERAEAARIEAEKAAAAASAYKVVSSGGWRKKSFSVAGNWTVSSENGVTRIDLDNQFSTKNAPDLKIFLSPLSPDELTGRNATQGALLISPLQSNKGAQSYTVPAGTNLSRYKTILIHCEAYSKLWSVSGL